MSQYGIIPSQNVSELQQEYSIANPSTWQVSKGEESFGGVEENEFSEAQKEEIINLGGQWFASSKDYNTWFYHA